MLLFFGGAGANVPTEAWFQSMTCLLIHEVGKGGVEVGKGDMDES